MYVCMYKPHWKPGNHLVVIYNDTNGVLLHTVCQDATLESILLARGLTILQNNGIWKHSSHYPTRDFTREQTRECTYT